MTRISRLLSEVLPWVLIAVLVFNMSQRRSSGQGNRKRFATLFVAALVGALWVATIAFKRFGVPDVALLGVAVALALAAYLGRGTLGVFRLRCAACGRRLEVGQVLYHDEARCADCREAGRGMPTQ